MVYLQRWHGWCHMKLLPSQHFLHTPCHFMQSHIHKVHVCLAVTCHLHFRQNDRVLLHATAVTLGWNRYQNKSQHRKLTMEKKILPLSDFKNIFNDVIWHGEGLNFATQLKTTDVSSTQALTETQSKQF